MILIRMIYLEEEKSVRIQTSLSAMLRPLVISYADTHRASKKEKAYFTPDQPHLRRLLMLIITLSFIWLLGIGSSNLP